MTRFVSCVVVALGLVACGSDNNGPAPNLVIAPGSVTLVVGASAVVSATFDNGDTTTAISWTSNDTSVATVTSTANGQATITGVAEGIADITASGGGASTTLSIAVNAAALQSITVTPPTATLAHTMEQQLTATGIYSDGSHRDISAAVDWSSSSMANVIVGPTGLVTAEAPGMATITAAQGMISGSATITATAATLSSIAITPPAPSLAKGTTKQLTATGTFSDHTTLNLTAMVTWASDTQSAITVSSSGLATAVDVGTATVTASLDNITGSTMLTTTAATIESIAVTPVAPQVVVGLTQQFTATATLTDHTTQNVTADVTWESSDPTLATIDTNGLATTLLIGAPTISATLTGGFTDSTTLTIVAVPLDSIAVTPTDPSVALGLTRQFTATGTFDDGSTKDLTTQVTWTASPNAVISNADPTEGLATGTNVGTSTITATLGTVSGSTTLTITPAVVTAIIVDPQNATINTPVTVAFTATGVLSNLQQADLTTQVTWDTVDHNTATISNADGSHGVATGGLAGMTTVTATLGTVVGQTSVTVATDPPTSIVVGPADQTVPLGASQAFTATAMFASGPVDVTDFVTWASTDTTIAQISNAAGSQGVATTINAGGPTTISATLGSVSGSTTLTVGPPQLQSIAVSPKAFTLALTATQQMTATGTFSNGTGDVTTTVSWQTGDPTVATVDPTGLVTAVGNGQTTITAMFGTLHDAATVTVGSFPQVVSIVPANNSNDVAFSTSIQITFSEPMDPNSMSVLTSNDSCAGTVQLTVDGTNCFGFTSSAPVMSPDNTVATFTPAQPLDPTTLYELIVTTSVTDVSGTPLQDVVTSQFSTGRPCPGDLVISQLYTAGGNSMATFTSDFVELHNTTAAGVDLTGMAIQYEPTGSTTASAWQVVALPSVTVPAGGYFLIQLASNAAVGAALPTPDFTPTSPPNLSATKGSIALTADTTQLTAGVCQPVLDLIGWGSSPTCSETAAAPAPSSKQSLSRTDDGCDDTNNNAGGELALGTPTPRNASTTPVTCTCSAN